MDNLKQLTHEHHKRAEKTSFIYKLLKKQITPHQYYAYLSNQFRMYAALEATAETAGVFDGLEDIKRTISLSEDLKELESIYGFQLVKNLEATDRYVKHIEKISSNPDKLLAHVYVRHMGDLSGGQTIKKYVYGSGEHYRFNQDVDVLKEKLRSKLHDGLVDEARLCFDMIREYMEELEKSFGDLEPSS